MDDNKAIYENHYGQSSFELGGDSYSRAMHDLRFELIERYGAGRDVLDVGCATGEYLKPMIARTKTAIGLDYTQRFLDEFASSFDRGLPPNLRLVCADARDMPLDSSSIDFAYSYATLYTVPDVDRVVRELGRIVRPRGHVALEFGNQMSLNTLVAKTWHDVEGWARPFHVRLSDVGDWLETAGFAVERHRAFQLLPLYAVPRRLFWAKPLSGQPLRGLLGRKRKDGRILDEVISGLPGLRQFAFRHLIVARRK